MGRLLAHEVGHALGANHDDGEGHDDYDLYYAGNGIFRYILIIQHTKRVHLAVVT